MPSPGQGATYYICILSEWPDHQHLQQSCYRRYFALLKFQGWAGPPFFYMCNGFGSSQSTNHLHKPQLYKMHLLHVEKQKVTRKSYPQRQYLIFKEGFLSINSLLLAPLYFIPFSSVFANIFKINIFKICCGMLSILYRDV